MEEQEPAEDGKHKVAAKKSIGFNHQPLRNCIPSLFTSVLRFRVEDLLLHDDLQEGDRVPEGRDCAQDGFFEPVVYDHDTCQGNTSFKYGGHLVQC